MGSDCSGDDGNISELDCGGGRTTLNALKTMDLYVLIPCSVGCVSFISEPLKKVVVLGALEKNRKKKNYLLNVRADRYQLSSFMDGVRVNVGK